MIVEELNALFALAQSMRKLRVAPYQLLFLWEQSKELSQIDVSVEDGQNNR